MPQAEFDVVVVGGGPAGATAAHDLARAGRSVLLLDREGRTKPCGGAVPPRLLDEFDVPRRLLACEVKGARVVAPSARAVDMPIDGGFVGMVDREVFDPWLRARAQASGARLRAGLFERIDRDDAGCARVVFRPVLEGPGREGPVREGPGRDGRLGEPERVRARMVVGADGALSPVARDALPAAERPPSVAAYHEIVRAPAGGWDAERCDVVYDARISPDFYGWVFPHGPVASIGVGSAVKGYKPREAVARLRERAGLGGAETIRREGAPIPLAPRRRWDNGRDVVLAGDAAGVVAPASGEGIYYAMLGGRLAAEAADEALSTGRARALASARARFLKTHGRVFMMLGLMQRFWYANDNRRERFVSICRDPDVQSLTWQAYMTKTMGRPDHAAHARILAKNIAHLTGLAAA